MKNNHSDNLKRSVMFLCILAIALSSGLSLSAQEPVSPLFLWETRNGDAHIYLAGSVHMLSEDFYPLPQLITEAVEQADFLVLEADVSSINHEEITELVIQYGMYLDGSTLADHIPEKLFEDVIGFGKRNGLAEQQIILMRPWLLSLTLQSLSEVFAGYNAELGMEMVLSEGFSSEQIHELESATFQIELLSSFSDKDQLLMLESSLDESLDQHQLLEDLIDSWKSGDDETMQRLINEPGNAAAASLNRRVITNRNQGMAEGIIELTEGKSGTYMVLVGSAHFLGEEGIPALLSEAGLEVLRVYADGSTR